MSEEMTVRKRGRPKDTSKDAAIREAAWQILACYGFEGLTFEAVAEAANCTRATLYRRFGSKIELVTTILHETSRNLEPSIEQDASPRDILMAHAISCAELLSGNRGPALLSLLVSSAHVPDLTTALHDYSQNELRLFRRELAQLSPMSSPEDIDFVSQTLAGSVTYHVALLRSTLSAERIKTLVDMAIWQLALNTGPTPNDAGTAGG